MIACALIPRLSLTSAMEGRREMIGRPVALAPEPGGPQVVGEVSGAAEAQGVRAGMRLAEALSRCPSLVLVPADVVRAEAIWEESLRALEALGAAVEPALPGEAFFATEPLRGIVGDPAAVLARVRRSLEPPARVEALRDALAHPVRRGTLAQARGTWERTQLPDTLERLGVRTLGELASLPAEAVADRFGEPGLRALRLARGADEPLRPRRPHEEIVCRLGLPEAVSGQQLERALDLLIQRLLAHPARAGWTIRRLRLEARVAGGGGWLSEATMRNATAGAERLRLALEPKLTELPGPAAWLGLRALELGAPEGEQASLARSPSEERRERLGEAVRQARAAAGRDALLRTVEVDPESRVPERRAILAPFSEEWDG